jgi:hypothetical protein
MEKTPKHNRYSIRLKDYDYSGAGAYFVTVCTVNREPLFGKITDGEMILNELGWIVEEEIKEPAKSVRILPSIDMGLCRIMLTLLWSFQT